jgi:Ca-activated chloride channel family protein
MIFQQPLLLLGLPAIPLLALLYVLAQRRRRRYTLRFTNLALLGAVAPSQPRLRRHIPPAVFLLGATALVTGLAQPILNLEVQRNNATVMLVIDVSGSMQATDVQPTRLEAAQAAARTLIGELPPGDKVGLVSFSGRAQLEAAPTDNRDTVLAALSGLQPRGATAMGEAIRLAVAQLGGQDRTASSARTSKAPPAMIVLLTDGVSNAGVDPLTAAHEAAAAGIPVQTIGIGQRNASVQIRGQEVGGVDEQTLQTIAATTGGKYYYAEAAAQLQQVYSSLGSQFGWQFLRLDITLPVLVVGVVALLVAGALSLGWLRVLS